MALTQRDIDDQNHYLLLQRARLLRAAERVPEDRLLGRLRRLLVRASTPCTERRTSA